MKKTIYTVSIGDYAKEVTEITFPFMRAYAHKIGADFHIIDTVKFPGFPARYEKLQIYELGRQHKNDWNIYIDSDALISAIVLRTVFGGVFVNFRPIFDRSVVAWP